MTSKIEGISAETVEAVTNRIRLTITNGVRGAKPLAYAAIATLLESGEAVLRKDVEEALRHAQTCVPFPSDCHDKIVQALAKFTTKQEG